MRDFRQLDVWQKAHEFTLSAYGLTRQFPNEELYGLTSQLRRASASIGANLAEGCGRETESDFRRFVQIATGSACEVEYHLILACDLGMLATEIHEEMHSRINEVKRMLAGLTKFLDKSTNRPSS